MDSMRTTRRGFLAGASAVIATECATGQNDEARAHSSSKSPGGDLAVDGIDAGGSGEGDNVRRDTAGHACAIVDHYHAWESAQLSTDKLHQKDMAYQYRIWPRMANSTHPGPLGHLVFYRELSAAFELPRYLPWEVR